MQIKVTDNEGFIKEFNGNIEYYDTYIAIKYIPTVDVTDPWIILVMPWRTIHEVKVRP